MLYIVSYDVVEDARRNNIAKVLPDYGVRVQYSVFECRMEDEQLSELKRRAEGLVDEEDSLRIYAICRACEKTIEVFGHGEVLQDKDVYIL
jgi:CRISPR-associated protein Cas2